MNRTHSVAQIKTRRALDQLDIVLDAQFLHRTHFLRADRLFSLVQSGRDRIDRQSGQIKPNHLDFARRQFCLTAAPAAVSRLQCALDRGRQIFTAAIARMNRGDDMTDVIELADDTRYTFREAGVQRVDVLDRKSVV